MSSAIRSSKHMIGSICYRDMTASFKLVAVIRWAILCLATISSQELQTPEFMVQYEASYTFVTPFFPILELHLMKNSETLFYTLSFTISLILCVFLFAFSQIPNSKDDLRSCISFVLIQTYVLRFISNCKCV